MLLFILLTKPSLTQLTAVWRSSSSRLLAAYSAARPVPAVAGQRIPAPEPHNHNSSGHYEV